MSHLQTKFGCACVRRNSIKERGKPGIDHIVMSTLALGLKINFDQPIKWMEFEKLARYDGCQLSCKQENMRNTM